MGAVLSEQNLTQNALDSSVIQDDLILSYKEDKLFGELFANVYATALSQGLITDDLNRKEFEKAVLRHENVKSLGKVFSAGNTTDYIRRVLSESSKESASEKLGSDDAATEVEIVSDDVKQNEALMDRLRTFEIKQAKYLRREMSYAVRNVDPFSHLLRIRFTIMERAFLAHVRGQKRLELAGITMSFDLETKRHFLCHMLGRVDFFRSEKQAEIDARKAVEAAEKAKKDAEDAKKKKDGDPSSKSDGDGGSESVTEKGKKSLMKLFAKKKKKKLGSSDESDGKLPKEDPTKDMVLTLDRPRFTQYYDCPDELLLQLLEFASVLPNSLSELDTFCTAIEDKRIAVIEKLIAEKSGDSTKKTEEEAALDSMIDLDASELSISPETREEIEMMREEIDRRTEEARRRLEEVSEEEREQVERAIAEESERIQREFREMRVRLLRRDAEQHARRRRQQRSEAAEYGSAARRRRSGSLRALGDSLLIPDPQDGSGAVQAPVSGSEEDDSAIDRSQGTDQEDEEFDAFSAPDRGDEQPISARGGLEFLVRGGSARRGRGRGGYSSYYGARQPDSGAERYYGGFAERPGGDQADEDAELRAVLEMSMAQSLQSEAARLEEATLLSAVEAVSQAPEVVVVDAPPPDASAAAVAADGADGAPAPAPDSDAVPLPVVGSAVPIPQDPSVVVSTSVAASDAAPASSSAAAAAVDAAGSSPAAIPSGLSTEAMSAALVSALTAQSSGDQSQASPIEPTLMSSLISSLSEALTSQISGVSAVASPVSAAAVPSEPAAPSAAAVGADASSAAPVPSSTSDADRPAVELSPEVVQQQLRLAEAEASLLSAASAAVAAEVAASVSAVADEQPAPPLPASDSGPSVVIQANPEVIGFIPASPTSAVAEQLLGQISSTEVDVSVAGSAAAGAGGPRRSSLGRRQSSESVLSPYSLNPEDAPRSADGGVSVPVIDYEAAQEELRLAEEAERARIAQADAQLARDLMNAESGGHGLSHAWDFGGPMGGGSGGPAASGFDARLFAVQELAQGWRSNAGRRGGRRGHPFGAAGGRWRMAHGRDQAFEDFLAAAGRGYPGGSAHSAAAERIRQRMERLRMRMSGAGDADLDAALSESLRQSSRSGAVPPRPGVLGRLVRSVSRSTSRQSSVRGGDEPPVPAAGDEEKKDAGMDEEKKEATEEEKKEAGLDTATVTVSDLIDFMLNQCQTEVKTICGRLEEIQKHNAEMTEKKAEYEKRKAERDAAKKLKKEQEKKAESEAAAAKKSEDTTLDAKKDSSDGDGSKSQPTDDSAPKSDDGTEKQDASKSDGTAPAASDSTIDESDKKKKKEVSDEKEKDIKDEKEEETVPEFPMMPVMPTSSPLSRILLMLQRDLIFKGCNCKDTDEFDFQQLLKFIKQMNKAVVEMLTGIIYETFSNTENDFMDDCIQIIENCFIGTCFLPLVTVIAGLLKTELFASTLSNQVWLDLIEILKIIDLLSSLHKSTSEELKSLNEFELIPMDNTVVVETPHSYLPNFIDEKLVSISGADYLCLQFDRRCNTERGRDSLEVCMTDGTPIFEPLHGPPGEWNHDPLVLPVNSLLFRFKSDANRNNRNYWGYACSVTGFKLGTYAMKKDESANKKPSNRKMLDLLHTLSFVSGGCIRQQMVGMGSTEKERAHDKWLQSPLFSKGFESSSSSAAASSMVGSSDASKSGVLNKVHDQFIQDLCEQKKDSDAMKLAEYYLKMAKKEFTDRLGGEIVNQTMYLSAAALLKHLGLVEVSTKICTHKLSAIAAGSLPPGVIGSVMPDSPIPERLMKKWESKVFFVFKLVKKLRHWIVSEKQKRQQETEAKITEAKERAAAAAAAAEAERAAAAASGGGSGGDGSADAPPSGTSAMSEESENLLVETHEQKEITYELVCSELQEKIRFLLNLRPYCPMFVEGLVADESTQAFNLALNLTRLKSLERSTSDGESKGVGTPGSTTSEADNWKTSFDTWKTLNTFLVAKKQLKEGKAHSDSFPDLLVTFIQCDTPLSEFQNLLALHCDRAKSRIKSMNMLKSLLDSRMPEKSSLRSLTAKLVIMNEWGSPLSGFANRDDGPTCNHFLSNVQSCGTVLEDSLRKSWEELYGYLLYCIRDSDTPLSLKLHAMHGWSAALTPGEEDYITSNKVLDLFQHVLINYRTLMNDYWSGSKCARELSNLVTVVDVDPQRSVSESQDESITVVKDDPSADDDKAVVVSSSESGSSDAKSKSVTVLGVDWSVLPAYQKTLFVQMFESLHLLISLSLMKFGGISTSVKSSSPSSSSLTLNLSGLQNQILTYFHSEVRDSINKFAELRESAALFAKGKRMEDGDSLWESASDIRFVTTGFDYQFLESENLCFEQLLSIRKLTAVSAVSNESVQSFLSSKEFMKTLFSLLVGGTPRIQRLALLFIRDILAFLGPEKMTCTTDLLDILQTPGIITLKSLDLSLSAMTTTDDAKSGSPARRSSVLDTLDEAKSMASEACTLDDSLLMDESDVLKKNTEFVELLFETVGRLMSVDSVNNSGNSMGASSSDEKVDYENNHDWSSLDHTLRLTSTVKRDLALDYVVFLRSLLGNEEWTGIVSGVLESSLLLTNDIIDFEGGKVKIESNSQVRRLLGALSVIGGSIERLRVGCRVELKISEDEDDHMIERGLCIGVEESSGLCDVLFDNVKRPVTIEMAKILPRTEFPVENSINADLKLLNVLKFFTKDVHFDTRGPKEEESEASAAEDAAEEEEAAAVSDGASKEDPAPKDEPDEPPVKEEPKPTEPEKPSEPIATEWICAACTYANTNMSAAMCEICGTPNPNPAAGGGGGGFGGMGLGMDPYGGGFGGGDPFGGFGGGGMGMGGMGGFGGGADLSALTGGDSKSKDKSKEEEPELVIPDMVDEPGNDELHFHQIRSLALKALCELLKQPGCAELLFTDERLSAEMLPDLLKIATRPTDLDQFRSVDFLEMQLDKISERIHDAPLKIAERLPKSAAQLTQKQFLKFSPFRNLTVNLPSSLDPEFSMGITFSRTDFMKAMFRRSLHHLTGYLRTNNEVPLAREVPGFYFEVKLLSKGIHPDSKEAQKAKAESSGAEASIASPITSETSEDGSVDAAKAKGEAEKPEDPTRSWSVAVGLWRSGMRFEGIPGAQNSYAFADNGFNYRTIAHASIPEQSGIQFDVGDTIGVLFMTRERSIRFTKNGTIIDTAAFDGVQGQFFPMVWMNGDGSQVHVNLGQEEFMFDFKSILSEDDLRRLESAKNQPEMGAAEMARRTMAQELAMMMGYSFPLEFAVLALEQSNDNMELAAGWLLENANREFDRILQSTLAATAVDSGDDGMGGDGNDSDAKDDDQNDDGTLNLMAWIEHDLDDPMGDGDDGGGRGREREQRRGHGESLLDDEVDARLPVGLTMGEITRQNHLRGGNPDDYAADDDPRLAGLGLGGGRADQGNSDASIGIGSRLQQQMPPIELKQLQIGQRLSVWTNANHICHEYWPKFWDRLLGKTGLIHSIDVNNKLIHMEFWDEEIGVFFRGAFPVSALHLPIASVIDPLEELNIRTPEVIEKIKEEGLNPTSIKKKVPVFGIGSHFIETEHALSLRNVRRSVLWLLRNWPSDKEFNIDLFGGINTVLRLLLLAGGEALSSGSSKSKLLVKHKDRLIGDFVKVFDLLKSEEQLYLKSGDESEMKEDLRLLPDVFDVKKFKRMKKKEQKVPKHEDIVDLSVKCTGGMTQALVEECALHFIQSVNDPNEVLQFESETHNPYPENVNVRQVVHVPGANRLLVTFDPRCHLANDFNTSLVFYYDSEFTSPIRRCKGRGATKFPTFIVESNRFWFKFTSSSLTGHWGYRFLVKPIEKHIDDLQALNGYNLELGCWLFELLLKHQHVLTSLKYSTVFKNSLMHLIKNLKSSGRARGIEQLIRLLLSIHKLPPAKRPSLEMDALETFGEQMDEAINGMIERGRTAQSQLLNSVVELMAINELFKSSAPSTRVASSPADASLPSVSVGKKRLTSDSGSPSPESSSDSDRRFNVNDLYSWRISIKKALWAVGDGEDDSTPRTDVTAKLQEYVDHCGQGTRVMIPPRRKWLTLMPSVFNRENDPDNGVVIAEKSLIIEYCIWRNVYDYRNGDLRKDVLKTRHVLINSNDQGVYIRAQPSTFDRVVEMSSLTLAANQRNQSSSAAAITAPSVGSDSDEKKDDGTAVSSPVPSSSADSSLSESSLLPSDFLGECARLCHIAESHYTVVPHNQKLDCSERDLGADATQSTLMLPRKECNIACPVGNLLPLSDFTVMFFIYFNRKQVENIDGPHNILRKGDHKKNRVLPHIYMPVTVDDASHNNILKVDISLADSNRVSLTHSVPINAKTWTHVAVTGNSFEAKLYIDGQCVSTQKTGQPVVGNGDPIRIGKLVAGCAKPYTSTGPQYGFDGSMIDCRYYVRCLSERAINRYTLENRVDTKPTVQVVPMSGTGTGTATRDPAKDSLVPESFIQKSCLRRLRSFNPAIWESANAAVLNLDNEVTSFFESAWSEWAFPLISVPEASEEEQRQIRARLRQQLSQLNIVGHSLKPSSKVFEKHDTLSSFDVVTLQRRFLMLQVLNQKMKSIFPLVDFTQVGVSWSLAARLCSLRSLIFSDLKKEPWRKVLQATAGGGRTSVVVNRPRALKAKERVLRAAGISTGAAAGAAGASGAGGATGAAGTSAASSADDPDDAALSFSSSVEIMEHVKKSIFGQMYRILNFVRPSQLRCTPNHRPWGVTYEGEGGTDAGGLFRDSLSALSDDIQSDHIPLFIKCPNSRGYGDNQDKWIPNPGCTSSLQLSMYSFVGKLMGMAIRGRHYLNLDLPSVVWKPLVGCDVTRDDIKEIDSLCFSILENMSSLTDDLGMAITKENFSEVCEYNFTTTSSDGRVVLLKPGGDKSAVTWENRLEYARLLEEYRICEFNTQVDAIRRGLATVVPIALLPLFTWRELELMVCGKNEIDVDLLKANTVYKHGIKASDEHVGFLWEVLREFTHRQRQNFLRFVWGQSRLPQRSEDFSEPFQLMGCRMNNDLVLPISHTCFFQLELPKYTSKEVMREKFLYAISNCTAIDTDFTATDTVNWDAE